MSRAATALLRGSLGTGAVQILSIVLSFVTVAALARTLGKEGFGTYSFALTWSLLLAGPATFGFGPVVTRETAAGVEVGAWDRVYGVQHAARRFAIRGTAAVAALALPGISVASALLGRATAEALIVAVPLTALSAALLLARHRLLGLRRVATAQLAGLASDHDCLRVDRRPQLRAALAATGTRRRTPGTSDATDGWPDRPPAVALPQRVEQRTELRSRCAERALLGDGRRRARWRPALPGMLGQGPRLVLAVLEPLVLDDHVAPHDHANDRQRRADLDVVADEVVGTE